MTCQDWCIHTQSSLSRRNGFSFGINRFQAGAQGNFGVMDGRGGEMLEHVGKGVTVFCLSLSSYSHYVAQAGLELTV